MEMGVKADFIFSNGNRRRNNMKNMDEKTHLLPRLGKLQNIFNADSKPFTDIPKVFV